MRARARARERERERESEVARKRRRQHAYLRRSVLSRAHDRAVVLMAPRGPSKIDERNLGRGRQRHILRKRVDEENVLRLEVGVRQLDRVHVCETSEAVGSDASDLRKGKVAAGTRARVGARAARFRGRICRAAAARLVDRPCELESGVEGGPHRIKGQAVVPTGFTRTHTARR